jgi:hypothetical protein
MDGLDLNAEQQAEAQRIEELLAGVFRNEARMMAQLLASKPNGELLGATEFQLREHCLNLGRRALETALQERKKRGTKGRA